MNAKAVVVRVRTRSLLQRALALGFTRFLLDGDVTAPTNLEALRLDGDRLLKGPRTVGRRIRIRNAQDLVGLRDAARSKGILLVEPTDWKVIPLENLLASLDGGPAKVWALSTNAAEARLFLHTLERGADAVVVAPRGAHELKAYRDVVEPRPDPVRLVLGRITRLEPLGLGDRVCVDTTSLLGRREGLLVGSAGHGFFLVASESQASPHAAARPFRVNAGAIHSYLWNGGRTSYLSELHAGTSVQAVDARGRQRAVTVGRSKIERRPLLLVEAALGRRRATVVLQNAETVRLVPARGTPRSVSALRVGDRVLVHAETGARHFGMRIQEHLREL